MGYLAENSMLLVQVRSFVEREEKLAVVRAWCVLVRHRHLATVAELDTCVNLVAEWFPIDTLATLARSLRITALNHKLPNHSVEDGVIVVLFSS